MILEITASRAIANDLMSNVDRDQPFSYTALCGVLVKINVVIMSTWKGVEWSIWLHNFGYDELPNQPKFWVDMLGVYPSSSSSSSSCCDYSVYRHCCNCDEYTNTTSFSAFFYSYTHTLHFPSHSPSFHYLTIHYPECTVLFCWNVSYVAMYDLGYMLFNPFGNRRIDVPVETITSALYKLSTTMADENISLPPALNKKNI